MKGFLLGGIAPVVFLLGCGGGGDEGQVDVYPVSGKVTTTAGPLAGATVTFAPKAKQPVAYARTDAQGNYALTTYGEQDGAAEGAYAVVITKFAAAPDSSADTGAAHGPGAFASSHSAASAKGDSGSVIPTQYTSSDSTPFTADVKPEGENTFNFEIK